MANVGVDIDSLIHDIGLLVLKGKDSDDAATKDSPFTKMVQKHVPRAPGNSRPVDTCALYSTDDYNIQNLNGKRAPSPVHQPLKYVPNESPEHHASVTDDVSLYSPPATTVDDKNEFPEIYQDDYNLIFDLPDMYIEDDMCNTIHMILDLEREVTERLTSAARVKSIDIVDIDTGASMSVSVGEDLLIERMVATADIYTVDKHTGDNILHEFMRNTNNNLKTLKFILRRIELESNTEIINQENSRSETPLYLAVTADFYPKEKVQALLNMTHIQLNKPLNISKTDCESVLTAAIKRPQYHIGVAALIADPNINLRLRNEQGKLPIHIAVEISGFKMINTLIKQDFESLMQQDRTGIYPLQYLISRNDIILLADVLASIDISKVKPLLLLRDRKLRDCFQYSLELGGCIGDAIYKCISKYQ